LGSGGEIDSEKVEIPNPDKPELKIYGILLIK
jgi:hypothetical protein